MDSSDPKPKNIVCRSRKAKSCLDAHLHCTWDEPTQKCVPKVNSPLKTTTTAIRCKSRKEKGCNQVPDACVWTGDKCIEKAIPKAEDPKPIKVPKVKSPEEPKPIKHKNPKVPKVKSPEEPKPLKPIKNKKPKVPTEKTPEEPKPIKLKKPKVPKEKTPEDPIGNKSPKVKTPAPPHSLSDLQNRHCFFYASDSSLRHRELLDINTSLKTPYDKTFKPLTNVHVGQRKLLLSEIQLLTRWYQENPINHHPTVLYVGAAPGTHLILLSYMFPSVFFVLYDGANFDKELYKYPEYFELHNEFVTTDLIKDLKKNRFSRNNDRLIFVSDIRMGANDQTTFEDGVTNDMQLQEEWIEILKPKMSLLKFRMSYNLKHGESITYTNGEILYGVWPKETSGETRLLVRQKDIKKRVKYDFKDYEQSMFFHNKFARPFCFLKESNDEELQPFIHTKNNAYCPCYDCLAELRILQDYSKITKSSLEQNIYRFGNFMNPRAAPQLFQRNKHHSLDPQALIHLRDVNT